MSGIEVIGLVLGFYPIVVNAWQLRKAATLGTNTNPIFRRLKTEQIIYDEFVQHLVGSSVSEAEKPRLAITNPNEEGIWKDPKLQADLKKRFSNDKLQNILTIVASIHTLLSAIQKEVTSRPFTRQQTSPLRYVLFSKHAPLQKHLDDLREQNQDLQRLFPIIDRPSRERHDRIEVRSHRHDSTDALDIYRAICNGYRCDCENPHLANLILPRLKYVEQGPDKTVDPGTGGLQLLFLLKDSMITSVASVASEITLAAGINCKNTVADQAELPGFWTTTTTDGDDCVAAQQLRHRRTMEVTIHECLNDQCGAIDDLCSFLRRLGNGIEDGSPVEADEPGFICSDRRRYKIYTPSSPSTSSDVNDTFVSLHDFLNNQVSPRRERMKLALKLSSAILQYYSTGWISNMWTWRDFSISEAEGQDPAKPQLFITAKFYSARKLPNTEPTTSIMWTSTGEPILTRLGFALIELAMEKRLSEMRDSAWNCTPMDPDTIDFFTARRILESGVLRDEHGIRYEAVVKTCLNHEFYSKTTSKRLSSRNSSFYQDFEEGVITPLYHYLVETWGID